MIPGDAPIGDLAISDIQAWEAFLLLAGTVSLQDAGVFRVTAATRAFITRPTDSPGNTPFLGTLHKSLRLDQSIIGSRGFGELSVGVGEIELINAEADYDDVVLNHAVDGRQVFISVGELIGREVQPYASFYPVADLTALSWHANAQILRIRLRDNSYQLEVPVQTSTYSGNGAYEGPQELAGQRIPRAFGAVSNITPAPVIPTELIYQVNDGPIEAVDAVYDNGVALTPTADYGAAALRSVSLAPGEYATALSAGVFRLGGSPEGEITCDVRGDNDGGYVDTTGGIVRRIAVTAAGYVDPDDLETVSFDLMDTLQGAPVGYYLGHGSDETAAQVIGKLMGGIGGWAEHTRLGALAVKRFDAPGIVATAYYRDYDLVDLNREPLPQNLDPPPRRFRVPYARNWTQQTQLAGSVLADQARTAYLASPYSLAATSDADAMAVLADHPNAPDPEPIDACFTMRADAQVEADRLFALYSPSRSLYRMQIKNRLFAHRLGETIHVTYPRFDLVDGRFLRIVEVIDDMDINETEIVAFG